MGRRCLAALGGGVLLLACLAACGSVGSDRPATAAAVPGYRVVRDLPLGTGSSRWEYPVLDAASHRLYLAHMGAGEVVVVDTARQQVVATVPGVTGVHGLALVPELGLLYGSSTSTGQVDVIDVVSDRIVGHVAAGVQPDGLTYVADTSRVFVSNDPGPGGTVIDTRTNTVVTDVQLGDEVGDIEYDPLTGLVVAAVGGPHQLATVEPRSQTVVGRYDLPGCVSANGVKVDSSNQNRVFVACEGNGRLLTVDLDAGRVIGDLPVGAGPDVLALDPALHRLYVGAESGILTVIDTAPAVPRVLQQGYAGPDAHSVAVDPDSHVVYLPLASVGGRAVLRELLPG